MQVDTIEFSGACGVVGTRDLTGKTGGLGLVPGKPRLRGDVIDLLSRSSVPRKPGSNPARHPLIKENDELGTLAHVRAVLAHPLLASANRRGCRLNTKREQEET